MEGEPKQPEAQETPTGNTTSQNVVKAQEAVAAVETVETVEITVDAEPFEEAISGLGDFYVEVAKRANVNDGGFIAKIMGAAFDVFADMPTRTALDLFGHGIDLAKKRQHRRMMEATYPPKPKR